MTKDELRIVYMGTPEFAVASLDALVSGGYNVVGVVTMPDKPAGRGHKIQYSAVKEYALSQNLPVLQPEKLKEEAFLDELRNLKADLQIVVAFRMLPEVVWNMPPLGTYNLHGSLLPKYRGAAPINWAIINGERETGITTMMTDVGMDTGDILLTDRVKIETNETAGELFYRLSLLAAETLRRTITALEAGTLQRIPQDESQATRCPMLKKEHGKLDFSGSSLSVHNRVRGTNPWPGAYALLDGEPLKIHRTIQSEQPNGKKANGYLSGNSKVGLFVQCSDGWLEILELQAVSGKRLSAKEFLAGKALEGKVLL